jgi:3-phenylpropionate/trans-cinnamate dioxygenase ferredoxin subunit
MKHPLIEIEAIPTEGSGSKIVEFFGREVHVYWSNGKPRAIANACLHFGGPLAMNEACVFVCAWHNAQFDPQDGARIAGPAPSGSRLMFLSTQVEDGTLYYVWGE